MEDVIIARKGEGTEDLIGSIKLLKKAKTDNLEAILVEIGPSEKVPKAYSHPGEEIRIVLEGQIVVHIDNDKYILEEGDVMWFDARTRHTVSNPGKEKAIFFVVGVPSSLV